VLIGDEETVRADRVKQLASLLDDLDASAKSSRLRTAELFTSSPPGSPREYSRAPDLSAIHEEEGYSDLDEMINNVPSDEEPDPTMSPGPTVQSTPLPRMNRPIEMLRDDSPPRLKSAQKTPAGNKQNKTVDFRSPNVTAYPTVLTIVAAVSK
jgi:hypothetical protein